MITHSLLHLSALFLLSSSLVSAQFVRRSRSSRVDLNKRATTLTGQYETLALSTDYLLSQNLWGKDSGSGSQTTTSGTVTGNTVSWSTTYSWSGGPNNVKSYANIARTSSLGSQLSSVSAIPSSWSWTYGSTASNGLRANVAYDLWLSNSPYQAGQGIADGSSSYEIMIWLDKKGTIQPAGSKIATVTVGGSSWDLWDGTVGSWRVYSFVGAESKPNFDLDLNLFFTYLIASQGLSSSQYLVALQAGTEPFEGSATFTTSSYSISVEAGGSPPSSSLSSSTPSSASGVSSSSSITTPPPSSSTTTPAAPSSSSGGSCTNTLWGQCGGMGYNGSTCCPSGATCVYNDAWYSQCLPGAPQASTTPTTTLSKSTQSTATSTSARSFSASQQCTFELTLTASQAGATFSTPSGSNLQKFTGALGGYSAPAITLGSNGRYFVAGSDSFMDFASAINRSCDIQHNKCADGSNAQGQSATYTVNQCDTQNTACKSF